MMRSVRARTASQAGACWLVIAVAALTLEHSLSFNLDFKIPVMKVGPEKSHFGYSVAQHKTTIPGAPNSVSKRFTSWMLVGAPKGENLQPGTNRSGALFKCPMTTLTSDCTQVKTDGDRAPNGSIMAPGPDEIKDDQWMGVTLKSQGEGGDILVCGHRYQQRGTGDLVFRWGYGLCYRLTNNFEYGDNFQPCLGKPVETEQGQFGYCQAGTSGMILDDEVVLGIPGTYTWRGTLHTRNISNPYLHRDKTEYFGVYTYDTSPVEKYSYLGYSVTAGKFFGDRMSYIAGAPRSGGSGQVIFFSRKKLGTTLMEYDLILNGEMFASSFGFEVLAMDINGDDLDDLVVSAPFFFTKTSSGAAYVYLNDGHGISNDMEPARLEGAPGESRFGFSMTSLGDLNLDGYNDLAIGAPYENKGAIYIFMGSKNGITHNQKPSQIIRAEDLPGLPHDAFGYSLSGGMDLDNNNYNDLLTSSFCSDRVILLRARPIIDIQTKVEANSLANINPNEPGCQEDLDSAETCFSFNACFKMMNEAGTKTFLNLEYNISERFYNDQPTNRIRFHRSQRDKPSTVVNIINLRPRDMGEFQCTREIVYLKGNQRDVLRPIRFVLSYKIHQRDPKPVQEGEPLPQIDDYPILNQKEAIRYFEATFAKECGDDDVCVSDLRIAADLDLEENEDGRHVLELGKRQFFTFTVNISNSEEPAYLPSLYVSHDKAIDLSLTGTKTDTYACTPVETGLLHCNLDNPLVNMTEPIRMVFKTSGFPFRHRYIDLIAWVNSTSNELTSSNNRVKFVLEVKRRAEISITGSAEPEQVFYSGDVVGESAIATFEEIGTEVMHKYLVDNRGPWKVDELQVQIQWPYQVENNKKEGKWLLYMTHIPVVDGDGECDVNPEYVNPLSLSNKQIFGESEVVIGGHDRLTGATDSPIQTTTKITKTSHKKVITSSTKKTYTKKTDSKVSSSSSSSNTYVDKEYDEYEDRGEASGYRHNRKVYGNNKNRINSKDKGHVDYATDEYENYDNFFKESDPRESHRGGSTRHEVSHRKRVYTTDSDVDGSQFLSYSQALNEVDDIKTIRDGARTYLDGYDTNGNLIWSSRTHQGEKDLSNLDKDKSVYSKTEISKKVYSSRTGKEHIDNNAKVLTENMQNVVDFRIIRDGDESWVNGYGSNGQLIWTTRLGHSIPEWIESDRNQFGSGRGSHSSSVHKEYKYKQTTRDQDGDGIPEIKKQWSSSVTDDDGTRRQNGSSTDGDKHLGWRRRNNNEGFSYGGRDNDRSSSRREYSHSTRFEDSNRGGIDDSDRNTESNRKYSSGSRSSSSSSSSSSSGYNSNTDPDTSDTSYRRDYAYKERTRDEDGDGLGETRSSWSSTVHDNNGSRSNSGSSLTDEHGTRVLSGSAHPDSESRDYDRRNRYYENSRREYDDRRGYSREYDDRRDYSGHETNEQKRFDWDDRDNNRRTHESRNQNFEDRNRLSQSEGFRTHKFDSSPEGHREDNDGYSRSYSSQYSRRHDYQNDDSNIHGDTFARAVVDRDSDDVHVYSQKIFSRKSGDHWQEIHGPFNEEEWSSDLRHGGRSLKRAKREREYIIKPEAITDAQSGKTMQVVTFKCDGDNPTAKCFTFQCTIRNLASKQSAIIRIPSRLWNSTLVEDYPRVSFVSIKSKGEIILPEEIRYDQDQTDDVSYAETLAYSNLLEQLPPEEVPLWVILVSVLAGLLLLVLIAILLWKLGFFKRKRPDPTYSGNIDRDVNGYN